MITAVYLENPFKPQNRVIRQIAAAEAPAVIDAVALLNANLSGEMILSVNGQKVAADHALKDGDFVVIAPNVLGGGGGGGGKNIAGIVAGIALMAFSGGAGAGLLGFLGTTQGTLGLGLALYFGGSLLMGNQKAPSIDTPRMQGAFENGYNWSPNQIRLQPGNPMPITFGTIRTSGQLIARRVWSAEFAGKQTQYLGLLLAAGEGPLDSITDIEINDTPIESIQGATYEVRLGTNHQNPVNIAGLGSTVEFQPFSSELPLSDSAWITKAQTEPGDKITLDFVFPAGLYAVDTSSGATVACRGTIRWEYREVGSGSWITGGTNTYAQQARRPFYFTIDFTPPDKTKTYEFRAQNYSLKDFATTYGGGWTTATEMPGNYSVAISWVGLTVNTNYAQTYPGVALVAISLPATENLSGSMPKVSWKQTRATVNVWNPTTEAYEQQDAQNIAWMVYYLIHQCRSIRNLQTDLDEYTVFGEPKENLNYTEFAAWANFCNYEVSAGVRRCHGNLLVDSAEQMWPAIQKIATSGRAFIIQQAGVFKPVWDSTRAMSQIFTSGNIIDGSLSGSFLPERERASAIEVSFINEDNGYERDTLFVTSDDYSPANLDNPTQVYLPAITSPKIAYMWAKHALKKNKYLKRTQTLQADIDSIVSEIGDVVGIQSDITSWGTGGRIMGATTTSVVIDQAVTLAPGTTYSLLVRFPDNTLVRRVVDAVLVSTTTTTLNFTANPWATAPERHCVYSFGVNTLETKPFQITGIRRNGDLQATLELLEYVAEVYTEATDFPVIDYTAANAGINSLTVKADSDTGKLGIAWTVPTDRDYTGSVVFVDGKPQGWFPTDVTDIDIDMPPGTHTVTVRPVDGSGSYGDGKEEEITLGSPTLSSVSSVSLTSTVRGQADGTNLVYITGAFAIPDLANSVLVEIGEGSNPASWATVQDSRVAAVQYGPVLPGTLYTLRFTAKNRYAVADAVLEPVTTAGDTTAPGAPHVTAVGYLKIIKIEIVLVDPASDLAGFEIWKNTEADIETAELAGFASATEGSATFIDQSPSYNSQMIYWAKSVDTWGNKSNFSSPSLPTFINQVLTGDITADQIIGKHFTTEKDVGINQDGVKFTVDGIEMWQDGALKVLIPATGDPSFAGVLTALAGYIGGWEIFPGYLESENLRLDSAGSIQTVDFVSGHRGWKQDSDGNAEFNNIRARGAVKTAVFEKDEISVVGGRTLIRPAAVVKDYDYSVFLASEAQAYFNDCLDILDDILDASSDLIPVSFADYDEYKAFEAACYREVVTALGYAVYGAGIAEAVYDESAKNAYWTLCWSRLNDILDETNETPSFAAQTYAQFVTAETGYFESAADIADDPPEFVPGISSDDTQIHLDTTDGFIVGEVIRIKDGISNDYWATISEIGEDDGGDYIKTVGQYGSLFDLTAGQTVVSYGGAGAGGVLLDGQAPLIDVYTHDGQPWDGTDCRVRIGNLKGWGTINHDVYGIAIGNPAGEYLVYDTITGSLRLNGQIQISGGSGLSNLSDAGALAGKDDIDLSYITDAGAVAAADDLDDISDGATHKKTTQNEKTGAGRAYSSLDSSNRLVTAVIPGTAITPAGAGLFMGSNYMGFHNGLDWKTYMDNQGNFALVGSGAHGLSWNAGTGVLSIAGSVSILSGSGYGNLTDKPTSLAGINSTEGSKLSGIAAGADVTANNTSYDTARVNGTAASTVQGGAAKANAALDASNKLITAVIPGAAVTPAGAGLFMGSNYMGFHDGANWKTYLDSNGNFALVGSGAHGLSWNAGTGVLTIAGSMTILGGSGYANLTDKPTSLSGINSTEGSKLTGIEAGADVTSTHTSADTTKVAGTAAATVRDNAANALANAATAQTTANNAATAASNAQTSADTANSLLANIADDNKFTPVEKQAARKEWEIIAAEKTLNNAQAFEFVGFSAGITEAGYGESAKNAYWTTCWNKLNDLIDETNAVPGFAVQTYSDFVAEESGYYDTELDVIYDLPISAPALLSVVDANNAYNAAFQALATYLNDGMTYSSGIPFWLVDANLGETWPIVGATFRATWKAYYDARTTLLNSIAARAKALADAAQAAAGIGAEHAATAHAPSDADHTQTTIDGGLVTTGTLQVVQGGTVAAGITGNTAGDTAVRFFAGSTFANRASAPFRVLQNGAVYATSATISGTITSGNGSKIAGFTATATDLTAGTGTNAIGISTDTAKKAFWAGHKTPASAPFYIEHDGTVKMKDGLLGQYSFDITTHTVGSNVYEMTTIRKAVYGDKNTASAVALAGGFSLPDDQNATALSIAHGGVTTTGGGFLVPAIYLKSSVNGVLRSLGLHAPIKPVTTSEESYLASYNTPIYVALNSSTEYAMHTEGRINAKGGYTSVSDERVKSDIADVSVLGSLKTVRVKKYRLDDAKSRRVLREARIEASLRDTNGFELPKPGEFDQPDLPEYNPNLSIGAMAADFNAAFGLNRGSASVVCLNDQIGVALRAIQELAEIVDEQAAELAELRTALKLPEKPKKVKEEPAAELTEAEIIETIDKNIEPVFARILTQSQEAIN